MKGGKEPLPSTYNKKMQKYLINNIPEPTDFARFDFQGTYITALVGSGMY